MILYDLWKIYCMQVKNYCDKTISWKTLKHCQSLSTPCPEMGTGVPSPSSLTVPWGQRTASLPLPWPRICWKMPVILLSYLIALLMLIAISVATVNPEQVFLQLPRDSQFMRITEEPLPTPWEGGSHAGERKPLLCVMTTPETTSFVRAAGMRLGPNPVAPAEELLRPTSPPVSWMGGGNGYGAKVGRESVPPVVYNRA